MVHQSSAVINVLVEAIDARVVDRILDAADRIRREYGVAVRVDVANSIGFDPLVGFTHELTHEEGVYPLEEDYVVLNDGSRVKIWVRSTCSQESLEDALIRAVIKALASREGVGEEDIMHTKTHEDPRLFAAGEYVVSESIVPATAA
ncbi:MAG: hypothetical protein LRS46_01335 [Desulfurococcales archaeon]|nr:hypothetical protein [Desulfurococcales archaeon]